MPIAGIVAAIHAVKTSFLNDDTEAVLLVNASNAFNSLNRDAALAPLGSQEFIDQFVIDKDHQWNEELLLLTDITKTQPNAAYVAFSWPCA